ncbi:MAG: TonB-dependent receptor [Bacteroidia bacterium]
MRKYLALLVFILPFCSFAQKMTISGNVQDTVSHTPMKNAVVTAVRIKDSTLVAFTRTDEKGAFSLKDLNIDTLQVVVSDSRFADQSYYVLGSAQNKDFDFGRIILPPKSQQLNEVIIYAFKDPVYFKGDTLVYTADSFKVKPNATVEDLLRKLPGIKVDAEGKITSQGKEISQVLVDGDEFFGSDPTVATKNLAANGVESVQVYEKKNENAGDGAEETVQVMNLQLKDDAKKGYFGKLSAASDFQNFYEGEALANKFKGAQKVSVFALASNTPRSSLGWGDMYKYGLTNETNMQSDDDGNMYWFNNNDQNQGVPRTFKSGFYYNDKITKKTKLGVNYTYNNNELVKSGTTRSQYFLQDTAYETNNENYNRFSTQSHAINFKLTQTIDSLTELDIEPKFKLNSSSSIDQQLTDFLTPGDTITRRTNVSNTNKASGYDLNATAKLTRKFKKKDRLLRLNYNIQKNENEAEGFLKSSSIFYNSFIPNDSIDQKKDSKSASETHNATLIYTEPITNKIKLEFDYLFNYNYGNQSKIANNKFAGEYSVYDSTLSNDFKNMKMTNRAGLKFIYETKKTSFNIGARLRHVDIVNSNLIAKAEVKQSVDNVLPFMGFMYRPQQNARLNLRYTTQSQQPTMDQLQPVPDNTNPNQVKLGNPDLLPTFQQNIDLSFNSYKPISGKYVWANLNYNTTQNAISNSIRYDSIGRTITQAVNVNGNYNAGGYFGAGIPFFSRVLQLQPSANGNYNGYSSYINGVKNVTQNLNLNGGMDVQIQLDTLQFSIGYNYDYNMPKSTYSTTGNKPYSQQTYTAAFTLRLPWKMLLQTDVNYTMNSQRAAGYNINYAVWNASLGKSFLKNENVIFEVSCDDILNQNIKNTRNVQDNVITDSKTNVISRYFLVRLTWKFNSTGTKDNDDDW